MLTCKCWTLDAGRWILEFLGALELLEFWSFFGALELLEFLELSNLMLLLNLERGQTW